MKNLITSAALALTTLLATQALAQEQKVMAQCTTRTVDGAYAGNSWMKNTVCKENEVALSGSGFCSKAGAMVGASTTKDKLDRDVWLWCSQPGQAVWYATCCQQVAAVPPPKAIKACTTRTVNDNFTGSAWLAKQVCKDKEVAVSAGGFCSKAGQMVGVSTTNGAQDGKVWLQCTQPGAAVWYGMCCEQ